MITKNLKNYVKISKNYQKVEAYTPPKNTLIFIKEIYSINVEFKKLG